MKKIQIGFDLEAVVGCAQNQALELFIQPLHQITTVRCLKIEVSVFLKYPNANVYKYE